jgi:flagellar protein FlbT
MIERVHASLAMSLKVELKPHERLIVGNCVITNSDQRTRLFIDGKSPILREKDILTPATANSPAKRIYLAVQLMYLDDNIETVRAEYFQLVDDIIHAAPSTIPIVEEINNDILTGALYKALRAAKRLVQYEQELLSHAESGSLGVPADGAADDKPA